MRGMQAAWSADEIRKLRSVFGESQHDFADRLGVSVHAVQFWEQGKGPPSRMGRRLLDYVAREAKRRHGQQLQLV
jgi:DNA-binding transcriptional regulator YiaG